MNYVNLKSQIHENIIRTKFKIILGNKYESLLRYKKIKYRTKRWGNWMNFFSTYISYIIPSYLKSVLQFTIG